MFHKVLHWAAYHFPAEAEPLIRALMNDSFPNLSREGAKIACVLALRSDEAIADEVLWHELQCGSTTWRCGLAEILANTVTCNIPQWKREVCCAALAELFVDEENEVRQAAARWVFDLNEEHLQILSTLFETFVTSPAYEKGAHWCHKFLLQHGELRPAWTLGQIEAILHRGESSEYLRHDLGDELVRCVLRLYTLPEADDTLRIRAIEAFGTTIRKMSLQHYKSSNRNGTKVATSDLVYNIEDSRGSS